jgi:hypothetical protein
MPRTSYLEQHAERALYALTIHNAASDMRGLLEDAQNWHRYAAGRLDAAKELTYKAHKQLKQKQLYDLADYCERAFNAAVDAHMAYVFNEPGARSCLQKTIEALGELSSLAKETAGILHNNNPN